MTQRALILFAHGARAASWAGPFERLQALTQARMPEVDVRLGFLELMTPRLPQLVAEIAANGTTALTIVPVFLGQGAHVLTDLPLMVTQLKADYPQLAIEVAEAVGENASVLGAIADYCVTSAS